MIQTRLFTLLCSRLPAIDNMIEEKRCTPASNAMCRCMEGYYCDKGAECKVCYPCSTYVRHVYNDTHTSHASLWVHHHYSSATETLETENKSF